MAGATFAGAVNYAIFASGIAAMEASEAIVRGSAASTASFAGAFGMVPNPLVMGPVGAFVAEVWMTGILLFLIAALTDTAAGSVPDGAAPALIGGTVGVLIGTFGPVTGCGMNPARDLGPSKHAFAATANAPHCSQSLPRNASLLKRRHADARAPPAVLCRPRTRDPCNWLGRRRAHFGVGVHSRPAHWRPAWHDVLQTAPHAEQEGGVGARRALGMALGSIGGATACGELRDAGSMGVVMGDPLAWRSRWDHAKQCRAHAPDPVVW